MYNHEIQSICSAVQLKYVASCVEQHFYCSYVIIKGEVLSVQAYGKPGRRHLGDVDVLVQKENIGKLTALLIENGFETNVLTREQEIITKAFSHQVTPYRKLVSGIAVNIDINYDFFWGEWDKARPSIGDILSRRQYLTLYDQFVPVLTIEDAFIQLCLHHYKDMNSLFHLAYVNPITSEKFQDIYYFWLNNRNCLSVEYISNWSKKYQIGLYIDYILSQTAYIMKDKSIAEWGKKFYQGYNYLLNYYGLDSKRRKKWDIPLDVRINNPTLPEYIRKSLSPEELEKLKKEHAIFA